MLIIVCFRDLWVNKVSVRTGEKIFKRPSLEVCYVYSELGTTKLNKSGEPSSFLHFYYS